jgi:hypothetical protein
MEVPFRPLGKVMEIASSTGLDITYAFDDLIFSEHSIFIIRFDKNIEDLIHLYINCDCEELTASRIKQTLLDEAKKQKLNLIDSGKFRLQQRINSEEIDIEFIEVTL